MNPGPNVRASPGCLHLVFEFLLVFLDFGKRLEDKHVLLSLLSLFRGQTEILFLISQISVRGCNFKQGLKQLRTLGNLHFILFLHGQLQQSAQRLALRAGRGVALSLEHFISGINN